MRVGSNTGEYLQTAVNFIRYGSTYNYVDWNSTLAMHDQWMTLAIVPFVLIWPHPESVIVLQVLALAATAPLLFVLVRRWGGNAETAAIVAIVYLLQPSVQGFANEIRSLDFVPLLSVGLAMAVTARSLVWSLVLVQLLCGTKEDVGLFVCWFGLVYAAFGHLRFGLSVGALSGANLATYLRPRAWLYRRDGAPDVFGCRRKLAATVSVSKRDFGTLFVRRSSLAMARFACFSVTSGALFAHWNFPLYRAGSY